MPPKIDNQIFEWLGEQLEPPPPTKPPPKKKWMPRQTPKQRELFLANEKHILCWGPKGGSKCRQKTAQVYTENGVKRLGRFAPDGASYGINSISENVIAFDGTSLVSATATGFWVEKERHARKCELANGSEFVGSPRHPLWVCAQAPNGDHEFGYASLSEIEEKRKAGWRFWTPFVGHPSWTKSDFVEVKIEGKHYLTSKIPKNDGPNRTIRITENIAYLIGALVGDGSLNISTGDCRCVSFTNIDVECINRVWFGARELGCDVKPTGKTDAQYLLTPAASIKPLIRALGIDKLSYHKGIPDAIVESPKCVAAAFIRGLFDTDGSVDTMGGVSLVTVSEKLSLDVVDMLAAFGILAVRRPRETPSGAPTWTITINGEHAVKFIDEIGFEIERKRARRKEPVPSRRCPHGFNANRYGYPDPIRKICRHAWRAATFSKSRINKRKYHNLCSFGSVPGHHKLKTIIDTFGSKELFAPFLISNHWLEVDRVTPTEAELFDLSVPGPTSFLASGTINHNTFGAMDKLVRHCYENRNALAIIVVVVQNMAVKGGSWDVLTTEVLPRWKDGNTDPKDKTHQKKIDDGLGLVYSDVKFDGNHCPFIWIQNKYGGWSMATVLSCPNPNQLRLRIRGVVPSFVFLDEATSCSGPEYFESVAAQLGRRPLVEGVQQFVAACNPEDPDNWVFLKWFVEPYNSETGKKDENFRDIFFPAEDNKGNLPDGYLEGLKSVYGKNATEAARMIGGEWVSSPSGDALFAELFNVTTFVRPLDAQFHPSTTEWLQPHSGYPVILGIDPGSVYNAFIFMQRLPMEGRYPWVIFDEIVILRKRISYPVLIPVVMRRMRFWRDAVGAEMPQVWISDESAFNVYRANTGSFDNLEIEKAYRENREKLNLEPMKMRACPKFQGSVKARIDIVQTALAEENIVISSRCVRVRKMFENLETEKQKPGAPFDPKLADSIRRSDHLHVFDAMSYPMLAAATKPSLLVPPKVGGSSTLISVTGHAA